MNEGTQHDDLRARLAGEVLYRTATLERSGVDEEARTASLAFSSEEPVERWFGLEILDHGSESVRLGRLRDSGPLLVDHDHADHVGVVEDAVVGSDRRGRALVRFGQSERAAEIFRDVLDGIRTKVSVGYRIHNLKLEEKASAEVEGLDTFRAADWEPFEVSLVSVPADATVGVGRSAPARSESSDEQETQPETLSERDAPDATTETMTENDNNNAASQPAAPSPTIKVEDVRRDELNRIRDIEAIAETHDQGDLARKFIADGKTVDEFRAAVLDQIERTPPIAPAPEVGLSTDETRSYSMLRLVRALANPADRRAQEEAGLEFEASRAVADKIGREAVGAFVPYEALTRDFTVGTAADGGNLVGTDTLGGSFVEMLENKMLIKALGAQTLSGLVGDVAIPTQATGNTAYWVAENTAITESDGTFGQLALSPKTVGCMSDLSRKLIKQSSIDVEAWLQNEIATRLAIAIDAAALVGGGANEPTGVENTSGVSTESLADPDDPTFAEIVNMEADVDASNALLGSLAYVTTPAILAAMKVKTKDSGSGRFVAEDGKANGYPVYSTAQSSASTVIFGNWADVLIGTWGGLDLNVDTATGSSSGTVRVVGLQDVDVAVRHAGSFSVGS